MIDTRLYGDLTIKIMISPAGVLMLSPPVGPLGATYATATNTETNSAATAGASAAETAAQGTGDTLSDTGYYKI